MMRYIIAFLFIVSMSSAVELLPLSFEVTNACNGTVDITIVNVTSDDEPVENAYVDVETISPIKKIAYGHTDSNGVFAFEGCGNKTSIRASAGGYESMTENVTLPACGQCNEPEPDPEPEEEPEEDPPETPPATDPEPEPEPPPPEPPPTTEPSELAVTSANEDVTEEEPEEEAGKKKPLPCCPSGFILVPLLIGTMIIKAKT